MLRVLFLLLIAFPLFTSAQISVIELDAKTVPQPILRDSAVDQWNLSLPGYNQLPEEAKGLLYWTNFCRYNPKKFWDSAVVPILKTFPTLNKVEAKSLELDLVRAGKLPMFVLNTSLITTAQSHSADIAGKKAPLSHTSTNGTDFSARMKRAGIKQCANENISLSSQSVLLSVVLLYLDIGIPSLGHRKALLDPSLRETGVGSALYDKDQYFLVQDFSCSQQ
ncbi:MAG: CAP domain-containing protein [Bacteroidota bacterium]